MFRGKIRYFLEEYDHTLADSVAEVLAPVNWLEVLPILLEAISWDEELQDVLEFLQGAEFRAILITVQGMNYRLFLKWCLSVWTVGLCMLFLVVCYILYVHKHLLYYLRKEVWNSFMRLKYRNTFYIYNFSDSLDTLQPRSWCILLFERSAHHSWAADCYTKAPSKWRSFSRFKVRRLGLEQS